MAKDELVRFLAGDYRVGYTMKKVAFAWGYRPDCQNEADTFPH